MRSIRRRTRDNGELATCRSINGSVKKRKLMALHRCRPQCLECGPKQGQKDGEFGVSSVQQDGPRRLIRSSPKSFPEDVA